jgi:mannose-6-phosphate isomerase-like protein (cupin superfamily)
VTVVSIAVTKSSRNDHQDAMASDMDRRASWIGRRTEDSIMRRLMLTLVCAGVATMAVAQNRRPYPMSEHRIGSEVVDRLTPSEMKGMLNYVAADARGAILPMSLDGRAQYIINARRDPSEPERHAQWDDVMIIQSGNGFLDYSRSIKGGKRYGPGEWRGGALTPVLTSLDLAPGVVVRIPAGVPHVIRPLGPAPLVYLVLKERISGAALAGKAP